MHRGESGQAMVEYALIACAIITFIIGMQALLAHTYQVYILHGAAFRLSYQLPKQYRHNIQCLGDSPEVSLAKINTRLGRKAVAFQDSRPRQCPNGHWVFVPGNCPYREDLAGPPCGAEITPLLAGMTARAMVAGGEMSFEFLVPRSSLCQGLFNEIFIVKRNHRVTKQYMIPSVDCR